MDKHPNACTRFVRREASRLSPQQWWGWLGVGLTALAWVLASLGGSAWVWLVPVGVGVTLSSAFFPGVTLLGRAGLTILFGEAVMLALTLLLHASGAPAAPARWYPLGGIAIAGAGLFLPPASRSGRVRLFGREDVVTLLLVAMVFASAFWVSSVNGPSVREGERVYVMRGYLNGDGATLFAFTQHARDTGRVPTHNLFAGNAVQAYPTLLHGALGILLREAGGDVARGAWGLMVPALGSTVAAMVVLFRRMWQGPFSIPWATAGALVILMLGWDAYVYPQSHTYLYGLFFLLILLLTRLDDVRGRSAQWPLWVAAWAAGAVLLFSNAILGTAAVAAVVGTSALFVVQEKGKRSRLALAAMAAALVLLFLLFPPAEGGLGVLNIAYEAYPTVFWLAVPTVLVFLGLQDRTRPSPTAIRAMVIVFPLLTFVTLFFSRRDIVADNASRFLYLLLFAAWPVALFSIQRAARAWMREARYHAAAIPDHVARWVIAGFVVLTVFLPGVTSFLRTMDSLTRSAPKIVSAGELAAFSWIRERTPADAVFARAPERVFMRDDVAPLALPAFTGRAQLRSDFWLSPDDGVTEALARAFRGEDADIPGADYLFCGPEVTRCPEEGEVVYERGNTVVRKLR